MVMIPHPLHPNGEFHMDDNLYKNIMPLKKRIAKDKDVLFLDCGEPGDGKSTIASQILYVLDPTIIERDIVFTKADDYIKESLNLTRLSKTKGKAIMHDEGRETGGTNVLKADIKTFWDFEYENRFLNMVQAIVQTDFFKTPTDVINFRARFMVWVVEDDNWNNGIFYFFGRKDMRSLYFKGKKGFDRTPTGYSFQGRFVDFWAGQKNYREKKKERFVSKYTKKKESELTLKDVLTFLFARNPGHNPRDAIQLLKMDHSYYFQVKKEWEVG
jgi:hypothetical protein